MVFCCTSDGICRCGYDGRFGYSGSDVHLGTVGCRGRVDCDRYVRILLQIVPNGICNDAGTLKSSFAIKSAIACDYSMIGDCSVIGEGHATVHSQGGAFRYGQRFARWNLQILLQGLISIDCASISIEDNASPAVLAGLIADR